VSCRRIMTKRAITETTSGTPAITYRIFRRKVHADQHAGGPPKAPNRPMPNA
jgi:hypothetical protein